MTEGRLVLPAACSKLNPFAEEFKPKRAQPAHNRVASRHAPVAANVEEGPTGPPCELQPGLRFMDIPSEVTRYCLSALMAS